eukprot:336725-Pleurochrysis_carterae.AAC.1
MAVTSGGHHSETSHTSPRASASNSYSTTPPTPLASVVQTTVPARSIPGKRRWGASATPGLSWSIAVAT